MTRLLSILTLLTLFSTGCGSTSDEDTRLRAAVEAEELQDQLQTLAEIQP